MKCQVSGLSGPMTTAEKGDVPEYCEANVDKQISPTASDHPNAHWRNYKLCQDKGKILMEYGKYLQKIVMTMIRSAETGLVPAIVYV